MTFRLWVCKFERKLYYHSRFVMRFLSKFIVAHSNWCYRGISVNVMFASVEVTFLGQSNSMSRIANMRISFLSHQIGQHRASGEDREHIQQKLWLSIHSAAVEVIIIKQRDEDCDNINNSSGSLIQLSHRLEFLYLFAAQIHFPFSQALVWYSNQMHINVLRYTFHFTSIKLEYYNDGFDDAAQTLT